MRRLHFEHLGMMGVSQAYRCHSRRCCGCQGTMRCLVTGGAGFAGSHLAEALLDLGHEVVVIDDLSTGRLENIHRLCHHPGFTYTIIPC